MTFATLGLTMVMTVVTLGLTMVMVATWLDQKDYDDDPATWRTGR